MCVLAVRNRKTFGRPRAADDFDEENDASALLVQGELGIVNLKCFKLCHGIPNICSKKFCRNSSQRNLSTYAESRGTTLNGRHGGKQKQVEGAVSPLRRGVRYFDVNNLGSALDRFWREKEEGRRNR